MALKCPVVTVNWTLIGWMNSVREPKLILIDYHIRKKIAGGLPLSGVVGKSEIMDAPPHVGGVGGTFSGNPVACAAALAVLDIMDDEQLPIRAIEIGKRVLSKIKSIRDHCPWIGGVQGLGAMQGIIIIDQETGEADKYRTSRIHQYALEHGSIMITAGTHGNVIRTLMPLTIRDGELNQSLNILSSALKNA